MFGQVLTHNSSLRKLDLSNNTIGAATGRKLQECIASNQALIHLDLRFTGIPQISEFTLHQTIEANDNRYRLERETGTGTEAVKLPGLISVAVNDVKQVFKKSRRRQSVFTH
ncbi:unnamed protein product [Mesocestoides corti]|nr:unnamed protein product [Mesocestoides corti]